MSVGTGGCRAGRDLPAEEGDATQAQEPRPWGSQEAGAETCAGARVGRVRWAEGKSGGRNPGRAKEAEEQTQGCRDGGRQVSGRKADGCLKAHLVPASFPVWSPSGPALPGVGATGLLWPLRLEMWRLKTRLRKQNVKYLISICYIGSTLK